MMLRRLRRTPGDSAAWALRGPRRPGPAFPPDGNTRPHPRGRDTALRAGHAALRAGLLLGLIGLLGAGAHPARAAVAFYDSFESKPVGQNLNGLQPESGSGAYTLQGTGTVTTVRRNEDTMAEFTGLLYNKGIMAFGPAMGTERWLRYDLAGADSGIPVLIPQLQTGAETLAVGLPAVWPVDKTWRQVNTAFAGFSGGSSTPQLLELGAAYPACDRTIPFHLEVHWKVVTPTMASMDLRIWNGDTPPAYAPAAHTTYSLASGTWATTARAAFTGVGAEARLSAISAYEATPGESRLIAATDPGLSYSGRWATLNGTERHASSGGQRVRFFVTGDWCYLRVRGTGDVTSAPPINIRIDNGAWTRVEAPSGSDYIVKVYDGDQTPGTHLVEVLVSAEWPGDPWATTKSRFMLQGLSIAPNGTVAPAPYPSRKVLFLGDSTSVGHLVLSTPLNAGINGRNEARLAAPVVVADLLGVDTVNASVPGMGFLAPMAQMTALPFLQNAFQGVPWSPETEPDAIIVNLGTNDFNATTYPDAALRTAVLDYLKALRAMFPHARIFMLRPFNGVRENVLKGALDTIADPNSVWVNTTGWLDLVANHDTTDGTHPNTTGNIKYAQQVSSLLNDYFATLPKAEITAPQVNATLRGNVTISGNAQGYAFQGYRLEYGAGDAPTTWSTISNGAEPVFNDVLGQWNTALVPGGRYTVRLTVIANNHIATASTAVTLTKAGDADADGLITLKDAALALKIAGGFTQLSADRLALTDVAPSTPDGKVDLRDAGSIARFAIKGQ